MLQKLGLLITTLHGNLIKPNFFFDFVLRIYINIFCTKVLFFLLPGNSFQQRKAFKALIYKAFGALLFLRLCFASLPALF